MAPFGQVSLRFVGSYCGRWLRWPDRQQAALAFDHDIAGIGCGRRDQRDPAAAVMDDLVANTLRTAAGLAKAATGQQQPSPPIAFRRLLGCTAPTSPNRARSLRARGHSSVSGTSPVVLAAAMRAIRRVRRFDTVAAQRAR
jgi:hypothetical protein